MFFCFFLLFFPLSSAHPSPFPLLCISWHSQGNRWGLWTGRSSRRQQRRWDFSSTGSLMKGTSEGQLLLLLTLRWGAEALTRWPSRPTVTRLGRTLSPTYYSTFRFFASIMSYVTTLTSFSSYEFLHHQGQSGVRDRDNGQLSGLVVECPP